MASGIGSVIVVAAVARNLFHWEDSLLSEIFRGFGNFLAVIVLVYLCFMLAEQLTARYAGPVGEFFVSESWLSGAFAPLFWALTFLGMFVPFVVLLVQAFRPDSVNVNLTAFISLVVVVAFWLKRYSIIVHTLTMEVQHIGGYAPTWVELAVLAGTLSLMIYQLSRSMGVHPGPHHPHDHRVTSPYLDPVLLHRRSGRLKATGLFIGWLLLVFGAYAVTIYVLGVIFGLVF